MTSLHHDLPPLQKLRDDAMAIESSRAHFWKNTLDQIYVTGTVFADKKLPKPELLRSDAPLDDVDERILVQPELSGTSLLNDFGYTIMERCVWGATYMSYLYAFLQEIQWDFNANNPQGTSTQWVELLVSFRLRTHLHTPVRLACTERVWQSPTVNPQLHVYTSLGEESTAFSKIIRSLELSTAQKLIPGNPQSKMPLSKIYCKNSQNSGITGRAILPNQLQVTATLNKYLNMQDIGPRQVPKLTRPLGITGSFTGKISPYDAVMTDKGRFACWKKFQRCKSIAVHVLPEMIPDGSDG